MRGRTPSWFEWLPDRRLRCLVCPRECVLRPGQPGHCLVRVAATEGVVLRVFGRAQGLRVDPVEKKPLYHFHPGSECLSFGTLGCNLDCRFCQNAHLSHPEPDAELGLPMSPRMIVEQALAARVPSIAFTYNEPVVFLEYMLATARLARRCGLFTMLVTAGYVSEVVRRELFSVIDAVNIDLKSIEASFYRDYCGARLASVLSTLEYVKHETNVWLEITNLLIPSLNDSSTQVQALARWVMTHLGPSVPVHFSAFFPAHRLTELPPTPRSSLVRAHRLAKEVGLTHVYLGNLPEPLGSETICGCGRAVIRRAGYRVLEQALVAGRCAECGAELPGRFV